MTSPAGQTGLGGQKTEEEPAPTQPGTNPIRIVARPKKSAEDNAPRVAPTQRSPWVRSSVAAGVLLVGFVSAWMAVVFKVKTPDGVVVLENVPKDSEIFVDGDEITFNWPGVGRPVEIRAVPGQHKVEVKKDGFRTFGEVVSFKTDDSDEITVHLDPIVAVRQGGRKEEPNTRRSPTVLRLGAWSNNGDVVEQTSKAMPALLLFGQPEWGDLDFYCEVLLDIRGDGGGHGSFRGDVVVHASDLNHYVYFEPFGWNCIHDLEISEPSGFRRIGMARRSSHEQCRWFQVLVKLRGTSIEGFLDGELVVTGIDDQRSSGYVGLRTWNGAGRFRNIKVTSPDGQVLWEGLPEVGSAVNRTAGPPPPEVSTTNSMVSTTNSIGMS